MEVKGRSQVGGALHFRQVNPMMIVVGVDGEVLLPRPCQRYFLKILATHLEEDDKCEDIAGLAGVIVDTL